MDYGTATRLRDVCNMKESEPRWKAHQTDAFVVRDLPWTVEKLRALPHFEFENWAVIALGGIPNKVQVGDMGVDGRIFPVGTKPTDTAQHVRRGLVPIQVKQMDKVGRPDIDAFEAVPTSEWGTRERRRQTTQVLRQLLKSVRPGDATAISAMCFCAASSPSNPPAPSP